MAGNRLVASVLVLSVVASPLACMHSTRISTDPDGADIRINGQFLGPSPIVYHDRSGIPKTHYLEIEKRGYKAIKTSIDQVYKADITLLLLLIGIFPYFFTATLEDQYDFKLQP